MSTIENQIITFKEKVKLCSQSYTAGSSTDILRQVSKTAGVNSLHDLRQVYLNTSSSGNQTLHVYIKWYLDTVNYLKELTSNFKSRIYRPLLQNSQMDMKSVRTLDSESDLATQLVEELDKLDKLLDYEGEIDPELFSPASLPRNYRQQLLVHLVPDILIKLDRAATLANVWLKKEQEHKVTRNKETVRLEKARTMLVGQLSTIQNEIDQQETELEAQSDILRDLLTREERSDQIQSENHQLELKIHQLNDKLTATQLSIADIQALIKSSSNNKEFKTKLEHDLKSKFAEKRELETRVRLLEYQKMIVVEDLCVEMEVKPSLIRLSNSVQDQCMKLENNLEAKRLEKQKLEVFLRPLSEDNKVRRLKNQQQEQSKSVYSA